MNLYRVKSEKFYYFRKSYVPSNVQTRLNITSLGMSPELTDICVDTNDAQTQRSLRLLVSISVLRCHVQN